MKKLILLMVVLGASVVLAEEKQKVFLIDGSTIEGKAISATDSTVSIETDIGMMIIKKTKILRIEKIGQDQRIVPTGPSDSLYIEQKIDVSFELKQKYNKQMRSGLIIGGIGSGLAAIGYAMPVGVRSEVEYDEHGMPHAVEVKESNPAATLLKVTGGIGALIGGVMYIDGYIKLHESLEDRPRGSFSISSEPAGAEVFLKGRLQGNTPLQITDLPAGSYDVMLVMETYRVWKDAIKIKGVETKRVHALLVKESGDLVVHSDPKGAEVYVEERAEGKTPLKIEEMEIGQHELELTLDGYLDYKDTFLIRDRETTKVTARLIEKEDHKKRRLANERYRRALMGKKVGEYTTLSLGIGCGIAAVISYLRAEDAYDQYKDAIAEESIEEHYKDYERSLLKSRIWAGTSGALALISTYFFLQDVEKPKLNSVNSSQSLKFSVLPQLSERGIWICVQKSF